MVLCLPLLLFVMALIVNAAYVAEWKVRSRVVARHELWSHRWERTTSRAAQPPRAQAIAGGHSSEGNVDPLDTNYPTVVLPISRGPWLVERRTGTAPPWRVREWMFDPSRELFEGTGEIEQSYPFLASMGPFRLRSGERLLDDEWRYDQIGAAQRRRGDPAADSQRYDDESILNGAYQGRTTVLYEIPRVEDPRYFQEYVRAAVAMLRTPLRPDLWVLDWDREYRQYRRRFAGDPLYDPGPLPDFHPRLSHFCTLDHDVVEPLVENLIQRIESSPNPGVAFDMARWFIGFYRDDVIPALERERDADPPPPDRGAIDAEIAELERRLEILQAFQSRL